MLVASSGEVGEEEDLGKAKTRRGRGCRGRRGSLHQGETLGLANTKKTANTQPLTTEHIDGTSGEWVGARVATWADALNEVHLQGTWQAA